MYNTKLQSWSLLALILSSTILTTFAYPNSVKRQIAPHYQAPQPKYLPLNGQDIQTQDLILQQQPDDVNRKFAEKPNNIKKVALDDIDDDIQTNQIQDGGFSWSSVLGEYYFNGFYLIVTLFFF